MTTTATTLRVQAEALRALANVLESQAAALEADVPPPTSRYATAVDNPTGSVRGFKTACMSGAFPLFKVGKKTAARWTDVVAYLEGRTFAPRKIDSAVEEERAWLKDCGVPLRGDKR